MAAVGALRHRPTINTRASPTSSPLFSFLLSLSLPPLPHHVSYNSTSLLSSLVSSRITSSHHGSRMLLRRLLPVPGRPVQLPEELNVSPAVGSEWRMDVLK